MTEASTPPARRASASRSWPLVLLLILIIGGSTTYLAQQVQKARDEGHLDYSPRHGRPLLHQNGKTLLWARGSVQQQEAEWFDVTDALVDPAGFEHGIGKDSIPSIDQPAFVPATDPRVRRMGIRPQTTVIGYEHEGEAKAYPIAFLNRHELVNDWVGGKPVTVGW